MYSTAEDGRALLKAAQEIHGERHGAAICDRAELWVHKNRTLAFSVMRAVYTSLPRAELTRG